MEYRSDNYGFASPKDIQSNVGSSAGVQLSGGSTGATVSAVGTDDNISLNVLGKGTGGVRIGSTSAQVFKGFFTSTFTVQFAGISSGQVIEAALSTATGTFAPGDLVSVDAVVTPAVAVMTGFRLDADASTRLTMLISNPGSTATSTGRVVGRVTWADLT